MRLGEVLDIRESLCDEFKEFCLKKSIYDYYTREEIDTIIDTGILKDDFNKVIYDTLQKYFLFYLPKYASGFSNCTHDGTLYIGVNDFCEVTGIPILGNIDKELINSYIHDVTSNYLRSVGVTKESYIDKITISIEELHINMMLLYDDTKNIMTQMKQDYEKYKHEYVQYLSDRHIWLEKLLSYTCKLTIILKNKNDDICKYIQENCNDSYIANIAVANTKESINTPINFEVVLEHKDNPLHFIYWLLLFKDNTISSHLLTRPKPPIFPKNQNSAFALITHISDLRHLFISKNKTIKYYLIKIKLPKNINKICYLEYKHPYKDIWDIKRRAVHWSLGPCLLSC